MLAVIVQRNCGRRNYVYKVNTLANQLVSKLKIKMLVKEKIGNLELFAINNRNIDYVLLDWYETNKRILHKKTVLGREVSMKFLNENPQLGVGDIVYEDDFGLIAVDINECDAIVIRPRSMHEVAAVCYEIGNKHLPLFYQDDEILVAYEAAFPASNPWGSPDHSLWQYRASVQRIPTRRSRCNPAFGQVTRESFDAGHCEMLGFGHPGSWVRDTRKTGSSYLRARVCHHVETM